MHRLISLFRQIEAEAPGLPLGSGSQDAGENESRSPGADLESEPPYFVDLLNYLRERNQSAAAGGPPPPVTRKRTAPACGCHD